MANGKFHRKNTMKDPTLERIIREVSKEMNVSQDLIWRIYNHYYYALFKIITKVKYNLLNFEEKKKQALNAKIPGFGRVLNRYGKQVIKANYKVNKDGKKDESNQVEQRDKKQ